MDYLNEKCPLCGKAFTDKDDIVVCPECGTPQHRQCYEELGHCVNMSKHNQNYTWTKSKNEDKSEENSANSTICKYCHTRNSDDALFCKQCGAPLADKGNYTENKDYNEGFGASFGVPFSAPFNQPQSFDKNEDMGNGVTADEVSKLVKVNIPYYMIIFNRIKSFGSGKFNFAAFFFTGGWYLYRKQYLKGAIISAVVLISIIVSGFLNPYSYQILQEISNSLDLDYVSVSNSSLIMQELLKMSTDKILLFFLPTFFDMLRFVVMIICGATANKSYFTHCLTKIQKIKEENPDAGTREKAISLSGGVDSKMVVLVLLCYFIIYFLPAFLSLL